MNEINKIAKSEIEARIFTDYENKFQIFIAFAIALLVIEILVSMKKSVWESKVNLFEKKE